jgi:hypothetical protein
MRLQSTALALLASHTVACVLPGDDDAMMGESSAAETGTGTSNPTTTTPTSSTTAPADTSTSEADTSGTGDATDDGPPAACEPACPDGELCAAGTCTPVGMSVAFGGGTSRQTFWDVAIGPDDNLVAVGNFDEIIQIADVELAGAGGGLEALVAKLDPSGAPIWAHAYVSEGFAHQIARAVAIDGAGNILVAGELQETVDFGTGPLTSAGDTDIFVLKLDPAGETVWASAYGDGDVQHVTAIATLPDDGVVLTGDFFGTLDLGGDPLVATGDSTDIYVAALDADGGHRWSLAAGDEEYQYAHAIAARGDIVVCGEFRGEIDLGGGPLVATQTDSFIAKIDAAGTLVWSIANADPGDDTCHAVAIDDDGDIAITGRFAEGIDYGEGIGLPNDTYDTFKYATVFDGDGNHLWSAGFGAGTWPEMGNYADEIAYDSVGNVVLAGTLTATANFGGAELPNDNVPSMYVARLAEDGTHDWSTTWPSLKLAQVIYGLAIDAQDDIVIAGEFAGELDLGYGAMSTNVSPDAIIARFWPEGP